MTRARRPTPFEQAWPKTIDDHPISRAVGRDPKIAQLERKAMRLRARLNAPSNAGWIRYEDARTELITLTAARYFDAGYRQGVAVGRAQQAIPIARARRMLPQLIRMITAGIGSGNDRITIAAALLACAQAAITPTVRTTEPRQRRGAKKGGPSGDAASGSR